MKVDKQFRACGAAALVLLTTGSVTMRVHADQNAQQACDTQQPALSQQPVVEWGEETEGFKLSLKANKKTYAVGESISLNVIFKNVSQESLDVANRKWPFTYRLEIIRPDGKPAPLTPRAKKLLSEPDISGWGGGIYGPGDKQETSIGANWFDMTQIGEYQVRVLRTVPKRPDNRKDENDKDAAVVSNVIKIRVEAAK